MNPSDIEYLKQLVDFLRDDDQVECDDDRFHEGTIMQITRRGRQVQILHGHPREGTRVEVIMAVIFSYETQPFAARIEHQIIGGREQPVDSVAAMAFVRIMVNRFLVSGQNEGGNE